jgi:glycosyltransferase involved in cell wall biosynthesis
MTAALGLSAQHRFVVPGATAGISGGNLYNRALLSACEQAGAAVASVELERAAERLRAAESGFFWLDTLYLESFEVLHAEPRSASLGLLVHYLPSLVDRSAALSAEELTPDERLALARADGFIVTSAWMRDRVQCLGGAHRPCLLVEPGRPEALAEMPPAPAEGVRAVLVANLVPGKGVLPFLGALARELTPSDRLELSIVGAPADPAYAARCQRAVAEDALLSARVRLLGGLVPDAALMHIARSNLLISSSFFEAYGMALCEARVCGTPIVARAGGNAGAFITVESGGELCASDAELARAVVRLCRDPALHASRLERARGARLSSRPWSRAAGDFIAQVRHLAPRRHTTNETRARTTR